MLVPGKPEDPIQLIDVRDVADWVIHCIENNIVGVYNATGPAKELSMKVMLKDTNAGIPGQVTFEWVDLDFLEKEKVSVESHFPLYAAPVGDTAGFHRCNISRALSKGLKFRPVSDTARATLDWYKSLPAELQPRIAPQFATKENEEPWLDTEKRLLAKWRARKQA